MQLHLQGGHWTSTFFSSDFYTQWNILGEMYILYHFFLLLRIRKHWHSFCHLYVLTVHFLLSNIKFVFRSEYTNIHLIRSKKKVPSSIWVAKVCMPSLIATNAMFLVTPEKFIWITTERALSRWTEKLTFWSVAWSNLSTVCTCLFEYVP